MGRICGLALPADLASVEANVSPTFPVRGIKGRFLSIFD
jgi:hypothetical protein